MKLLTFYSQLGVVPIEEKNIETNKHQEENNNIVFDDDEIEQEITDIDFEDDEDDF